MIRIAYVFTAIEFGGSERVNLTFLERVNRTRFQIVPVILIRPWEEEREWVRQLKEVCPQVERIPVAKRRREQGWDPLRIARCTGRMDGIIRNGDFHIVHTHGYFADIIGIPIAKLRGCRTVSTCHGFIENDRKLKIYNALDRLVLRSADRVIAVSATLRDELIENGISEEGIAVIQNAVEDRYVSQEAKVNREKKRAEVGVGHGEFVIGTVGRLSKEKGLRNLLEALGMLRDRGVPVRAIIVGDGPERDALKQYAKEEQLEEAIAFVGFRPEVQEWLPAFDLFVLPSLSEGTPVALLEAMASGLPVLCSRVGGIPGVVEDEVNGLLVPPGDVDRLTEGIERFRADQDWRNRIAREGRRTVLESHSPREWCSRIEEQYDLLLR